MSLRFVTCASIAITLTLTGCGSGGGDNSSSAATASSSSSRPVVSIADAMKSDAAATKACQALVGDGAAEAKWLASIYTEEGTKVVGEARASGFDSPGFSCTIEDKPGKYAGEGFSFISGQEPFQSRVQEALEGTDTKEEIASAWNDESQVGVYASSVSTDKNQTATSDMQQLVFKVGK